MKSPSCPSPPLSIVIPNSDHPQSLAQRIVNFLFFSFLPNTPFSTARTLQPTLCPFSYLITARLTHAASDSAVLFIHTHGRRYYMWAPTSSLTFTGCSIPRIVKLFMFLFAFVFLRLYFDQRGGVAERFVSFLCF